MSGEPANDLNLKVNGNGSKGHQQQKATTTTTTTTNGDSNNSKGSRISNFLGKAKSKVKLFNGNSDVPESIKAPQVRRVANFYSLFHQLRSWLRDGYL
jgi:hypothetical protein